MDINYPRPQFRRDAYLLLDGEWDYRLSSGEVGKIIVPYVYQSIASGIGKPLPGNDITYERYFTVPDTWRNNRVVLHFGAVDYECDIYVNGQRVASHIGGQSSFSVDITEFLVKNGDQRLIVNVKDEPNSERIPRGKQSWTGSGEWIFYTPSTGIWQSVWLEPVPENALEMIRYYPDVDKGRIQIVFEVNKLCNLPCCIKADLSLNGKPYASGQTSITDRRGEMTLDLFQGHVLSGTHFNHGLCWSPENPILFDVDFEVTAANAPADIVHSYFGMRKIECRNGLIYLNNHPYTQRMVLDQGYWPDGLMTPPSVDAFREDIEKSKEMGFNGCRKHEKVEDPRFLFMADRLGYLVWGSISSFYRFDESAVSVHLTEWISCLKRDFNHPSIVCWDMLNESWGVPNIRRDSCQQQYANALYALAHAIDGTRPVISNDGWEMTNTDICALHSYQHGSFQDIKKRERFRTALVNLDKLSSSMLLEHHEAYANGYGHSGQPIILSEFGGMTISGGSGWGYFSVENDEAFLADFDDLISIIEESGMFCGFCYTQLTDVEQEKNGLLDARRNFKVSPDKIRKILLSHPFSFTE